MTDIADRTIHILLLDDHALFRESISRLLSAQPGFVVAAQCGTIDQALETLRQRSIDIVLLDFGLGENDGREFVRLAKAQGFKGKILVVTAGIDRGETSDLIRSGVAGIFRKHDSAALLVQGICDVVSGKVWLDQEQLEIALKNDCKSQARPFTERERQVLSFVFESLTNKEIAARIGVTEGSIKATLQQLFSKAGVRTRNQLLRSVLEHYRDQL